MSHPLLRTMLATAACLACLGGAQAQTLLSEGFEDVGALTSGANPWINFNGSTLPMAPGFGQGDAATIFPAQSGSANSYAFSSFAVNGDDSGQIYALLLTPTLDLSSDVALSFWTRTVRGSSYPDRLAVGVLLDDPASTSAELLSVNYSLFTGGYPQRWSQFTVDLGGQGAGMTGRFYFEYFIPDASVAGDYIALDTVTVQAIPVPEPASALMLCLGLGGLGLAARRRA